MMMMVQCGSSHCYEIMIDFPSEKLAYVGSFRCPKKNSGNRSAHISSKQQDPPFLERISLGKLVALAMETPFSPMVLPKKLVKNIMVPSR